MFIQFNACGNQNLSESNIYLVLFRRFPRRNISLWLGQVSLKSLRSVDHPGLNLPVQGFCFLEIPSPRCQLSRWVKVLPTDADCDEQRSHESSKCQHEHNHHLVRSRHEWINTAQ